MLIINRIKNLAELSKYTPKQEGEEVVLSKTVDGKPKGQATIVEDDPLDVFPTQE